MRIRLASTCFPHITVAICNALLYVLLSTFTNAQTVPVPKFESPNAASLGKFGEIPVSHFTGVPDISIPVYEINSGNIKIPLSLRYHPGSVKPNEHPGWVGLGWNLQSYGRISRRIRGKLQDEISSTSLDFLPFFPEPLHVAGNGADLINTTDWETVSRLRFLHSQIANTGNIADFHADEFTFNFLGYSGSFYYTADGWKVASSDNIKVELTGFITQASGEYDQIFYQYAFHPAYSPLTTSSRSIRGFVLTTPDGKKYTFGCLGNSFDEKDGVEFQSEYEGFDGGVTANTWLLRKVEDPDGHSVVFEYKRTYPTCTISFWSTSTDFSAFYDWTYSVAGWNFSSIRTTQYTGTLMWPVYLSKIVSSDQIIDFNTTPSTELRNTKEQFQYIYAPNNGGSYPYIGAPSRGLTMDNIRWEQLNSITVRKITGEPLRKFKFDYSSSSNQRLTLNALKEYAVEGLVERQYSFTYHGNVSDLPAYGGDKTDHWGFYNSTQSMDFTLYEDLLTTRAASATLATIGLLKTLTYPTGGHTEYIWESHKYGKVVSKSRNSLDTEVRLAGGCRIAEIRSYTEPLAVPLVKKFYYVKNFLVDPQLNIQNLPSSGVLNARPEYVFHMSQRRGMDGLFKAEYTLRTINGQASYTYTGDGSYIGYSEVVEHTVGNGYTKYHFTNYDSDLNGQSHFDKTPVTIGWEPGEDSYITMSSLEVERGKPIRTAVYTNDNYLVETTTLTYRSDLGRFDDYIRMYDTRNTFGVLSVDVVVLSSAYRVFKYKYYPVKIEKSVFDKNGINSVTTTTEMEYNAFSQVSKSTVTESSGKKIITKYKYPVDYTILATPSPSWEVSALKVLQEKNMIEMPVETQSIKEEGSIQKLIGGSVVKFNLWNNIIKPKEEFRVESTNGLTSFALSTINSSNQFVFDNAYQKAIAYSDYDSKGNLLCYAKENDHPNSYEWDPEKKYPIVAIVNAKYIPETYNDQIASSSLTIPSGVNEAVTTLDTYQGTIQLNLDAHPGKTYSLEYSLVGPVVRSGTLCSSSSSTLCQSNHFSSYTFTDMPAGRYTLYLYYYGSDPDVYRRVSYTYPRRQLATPPSKEFFYNGFEEQPNTDIIWPFTGKKAHYGSYTVPFLVPNSRSYKINYHYQEGGIWKNKTVPYTNNMTLSDGNGIDEVRVYPSDALMTTYTYNPLIGMTSQTDAAGKTTFYQYDFLGRLSQIRDEQRNIVKVFCYNYQGNVDECQVTNTNHAPEIFGVEEVYMKEMETYTITLRAVDPDPDQLLWTYSNNGFTQSENVDRDLTFTFKPRWGHYGDYSIPIRVEDGKGGMDQVVLNLHIQQVPVTGPTDDGTLPHAPRNVTATIGTGSVILNWENRAYNAETIKVFRRAVLLAHFQILLLQA